MTPEQMRAEIERLQAQVASLKADSNTTKPAGTDSTPLEGNTEREAVGKTESMGLCDSKPETVVDAPQSMGRQIVETCSTSIAHAQARSQIATDICVRICEGQSLNKVCKEPDMPSLGTFLRWCAEDAEVGQMYVSALRIRAAWHAEQLQEDMDELDKCSEAYEVQALKVKINTRQWIMSRLLPKHYGEKIEHEHSGEIKLDEKQIDARLAHLVGRIKGSTAR